MAQSPEVVIVSAVRTAIGSYGGALKDFSPSQMGAIVVREAIVRAGIEAESIQHLVCGNVIHGEPRDMYVSRAIALDASAMVGYQPAPFAAAMAAPSDEASMAVDRSTGRAVASARICIQRSDAAPPPMAT